MKREFYIWKRDPAALGISAAGFLSVLFIRYLSGELYLCLESVCMWLVLFTGLSTCLIFGREYDNATLKILLQAEKKSAICAHKLCFLYIGVFIVCVWCALFLYLKPEVSVSSGAGLPPAVMILTAAVFLCLHSYIWFFFLLTELFRKAFVCAAFSILLFFLENRFHVSFLPQNLLFSIIEKELLLSGNAWKDLKIMAGYSLLLIPVSIAVSITRHR